MTINADVSDVAGKEKKSNTFLMILLFVVVAIVVILGALVIINALNRNGGVNGDAEPYARAELKDYIKGIDWEAEETGDVDEGAKVYEKALAESINDEDKLLSLRIAFSVFLTQYNYMEESLEQLNLANQAELSDRQLMKLYIAYRGYYLLLDDSENVELYNSKINALVEKNNYSDHEEF